jgi:hypothetical protein
MLDVRFAKRALSDASVVCSLALAAFLAAPAVAAPGKVAATAGRGEQAMLVKEERWDAKRDERDGGDRFGNERNDWGARFADRRDDDKRFGWRDDDRGGRRFADWDDKGKHFDWERGNHFDWHWHHDGPGKPNSKW